MSDAGPKRSSKRRTRDKPRRRAAGPEPERTLSIGGERSDRPADPANLAELPDTIGQYRILGRLGEGGMGRVFEAEQQNPKRKVAVKVVYGDRFLDDTQVRMLQREAEALARLKHPNIAAIHESGRTPGGRHFFAMELVLGDTLHTYLAGRPRSDTRDELEHRLVMFRQICDTVSYAHQRGVIHRDLKPSNIIVIDDGSTSADPPRSGVIPQIKILDFGLARLTDRDVQASMMTEVGVIKGTLPYMSPEQVRGDPQSIDVRSDVYALGVILYEMLAGQRPYETRGVSILEAARIICEKPPRPLRRGGGRSGRLDQDLETIVGKTLEKDPDRRYDSAAALSDDVGRYLSDQPILARPPSSFYQFRKFAQRHRVLVSGATVLLVTLVVGAILAAGYAIRESRKSEQLQRFAYRSLIRSAVEAIEQGDRLRARELLLSEQVPQALRGWEWHHLWARSEPPGLRVESPEPGAPAPRIALVGGMVDYRSGQHVYRFDPATGERIDHARLDLDRRGGFPPTPERIEHGPGGWVAALTDRGASARVHLFHPGGEACGVVAGEAMAFGPAGSQLAWVLGGDPARALLWDLTSCTEKMTLEPGWGRPGAISADGTMISLYRVYHDQTDTNLAATEIRDTRTGRLIARFPMASESSAETFTPDGALLLSASREGDLRIFELARKYDRPLIEAHDEEIDAIAVSANGRLVATSAADSSVRLWDIESRDLLAKFQVGSRAVSMKFSDDDRLLLRVDDEGGVTVLDTAERGDPWLLAGHRTSVLAVAIHPDGDLIATGDFAGDVFLWDADSGRKIGRLGFADGAIRSLRFSGDGRRLIGTGSEILVWELGTGRLLASIERHGGGGARETVHTALGTPLDPAGSVIVTGWKPEDGFVETWNVESGEAGRASLAAIHPERAEWLSENRRFAAGAGIGADGVTRLAIHDLIGEFDRRMQTTGGAWRPFAFGGAAGRTLLAATLAEPGLAGAEPGSTVGLWHLEAGRKIGELSGHEREVLAIAFTPDASRIVTGSRDGTIRFWDPQTCEEIAWFKEHRLFVKDLAFSPDGQRLVTASGDETVRVWEIVAARNRFEATRQQDAAAEEARPLVAALIEGGDLDAAIEQIETDPSLGETVRREALREVLRVAIRGREAHHERSNEHAYVLSRTPAP